MKFTTAGFRQQYTLMPTRMPVDQFGRMIRDIPGLSVSSGSGRIIDTDAYPAWTREEKYAMERHLLGHHHFGTKRIVDRGEQQGDVLLNTQVWQLWFAPDQEIPPEHLDWCKEQSWYKSWDMATAKTQETPTGSLCLHTVTDGSAVLKCSEPAIGGSEYCGAHQMAVV